MSDQNSNQNPETAASEPCALNHAPITVQCLTKGYRLSAVVDGNRMMLTFPDCTLSDAFADFEQLIAEVL